jgi:hypothetical protein
MLSNTARNSFTTAQAAYLKRGEVLARFKQFTAEKAPYLFTCDPYKIFTGCPVSSSKFPRPITGKWSEETLEIPMYLLPPIPSGAKYGRDIWYHPKIKEMSPYTDGSISIKSPRYSVLYWGAQNGLFYAYLDTEDGSQPIFELPHVDVVSALLGLKKHQRNHRRCELE